MIESIIMLAALVALGWVLLWSMIQEKVRPGKPAKGFFAMRHDLEIQEKSVEAEERELRDEAAPRPEKPRKKGWQAQYRVNRGRYHPDR